MLMTPFQKQLVELLAIPEPGSQDHILASYLEDCIDSLNRAFTSSNVYSTLHSTPEATEKG